MPKEATSDNVREIREKPDREQLALDAMDRMAEQIEQATSELRKFIAEQRSKRAQDNA